MKYTFDEAGEIQIIPELFYLETSDSLPNTPIMGWRGEIRESPYKGEWIRKDVYHNKGRNKQPFIMSRDSTYYSK